MITDSLIEMADPSPSEIRRWIGEARAEGAAAAREQIAKGIQEAADRYGTETYYSDRVVREKLADLAARCRAGELG